MINFFQGNIMAFKATRCPITFWIFPNKTKLKLRIIRGFYAIIVYLEIIEQAKVLEKFRNFVFSII